MLSREDNELLCRVGTDTPVGALLRQYWIPALMSSELPERDGAPVRVRLLGEGDRVSQQPFLGGSNARRHLGVSGGGRVVADPFGPDPELALGRRDWNQLHAARNDVVPAGLVEVVRRRLHGGLL